MHATYARPALLELAMIVAVALLPAPGFVKAMVVASTAGML